MTKFNFYHLFSLITAVFESLCYGGLVAGWPALQYIFKEDGYFGGSCPLSGENTTTNNGSFTTEDKGCSEQDRMLGLVCVVAMTCMFFTSYVFGYIYDRWGTRVSRCLGTLLFNTGCFLIIFSTPESSFVLFPALILLAIGGDMFAVVSNTQLSNLFGSWRSSCITLLVGSCKGSSVVALMMKVAYEAGMTTKVIFVSINCLTAVVWFRTFFCMPKMHIPYPLPKTGYTSNLEKVIEGLVRMFKPASAKDKEVENNTTPLNLDSNKNELKLTPAISSDEEEIKTRATLLNESVTFQPDNQDNIKPFSKCLKTPMYWNEIMYMSLINFRSIFFFSSFLPWLNSSFVLENAQQASIINIFVLTQASAMLVSPFNGIIIDLLTKRFSHRGSSSETSIGKALFLSKALAIILTLLFSVMVCVPFINLQYLSFFVLVMWRSFTYGGYLAFIASMYPREHFGKLLGFGNIMFGLAQLAQSPLLTLALGPFDGNFLPINILFCCLLFANLIYPTYYYKKLCRRERTGNTVMLS